MKAYGKLYGSCLGKRCFARLQSFLVLIFVSVCAVCMLTGCDGEPQVMSVPVPFDEQYCVMRPDVADKTEVDAAVKLAGKLNETFGRKPTLTSDWVNRGETIPETAYEILIGRTNRPETAEAAELLATAASRGLDSCILYRNQRIVLFGMTPEATLSAVV